ncbi:TetR/AcrR family transcriptional regulator [Umezawaea endophytica]|uniref:TetR/AcrR family transcriptional regulator n=1 Tax=Umezawaea endophytica TaxID=1654476 RepID=A0A9X2VPD4_9PSEU|nr:TetR/AcrR family transcriptional regulator [Umezawaea endophytica]MCS7480411.1 TetR/AcrR family transcriptional regulator [Umezawaea endophytica]
MEPTADRHRKPNPRGAGGELREEIVGAATRLVEATADPSGITLRGVAREAGITAPSIYPHFDNLDAVMAAVVDRAFDELRSTLEVARTDDPVERLRALCRAYASFAVANPRLYGLLFSQEKVSVLRQVESGLLAPKSVDTMPGAHAFALLVHAISACVEVGRSTSTDPQRDATLLWTALHGYVTLLHSTADFPWPARDSMLDQYADRLAFLVP